MSNERFNLTQRQRFLRGLIFLSAGIFLLIQFAAGDSNNPWLQGISWGVATFTVLALVAFLWTIFQQQ